MPRFLHTADWQIGRQYGQFDTDDAAVLAEARYETVARIAELASARQVDAVLVAGDVFDTQAVSDRTLRRLFGALSAYAGPWVLISGNHDAMLADSVWTRAERLACIPPNVHIARTCEAIVLEQAGMAVLAAPLTQRHTYDDVTQGFDALETPASLARIGLAHGSVRDRLPGDADAANPIAPDRASLARLDYLALGDWHGYLQIDPRTWYAGTPEQDRFRGNAPGHVLDVALDAPGETPRVTPVRVGRFEWLHWSERLALDSDAEALAHRLGQVQSDQVLRLALEGGVSLSAWTHLQQAVDRAAAQARAVVLDATALAVAPAAEDLDALRAGGYVADVAARLQAMQEDPANEQATVAREALRLLLRFHREAAGGRA